MFCPNRECEDFKMDGIHGEYESTVSVCPKCGAKLVPELPRAAARRAEVADESDEPIDVQPTVPGGRLVALAAYDGGDDIEPIMAALIDDGVDVFEFLDDGRDFQDNSGVAPCIRLLVPESQYSRARAVLERIERGT